jgi:hypothetical protein
MRGWSSILVGFLLLGVAYWSFAVDGFGSSTLLCGVAASFFFFRGAQGQELDEGGGDPTAVVDFVSDPAEAIVDSVTDRLADWLGEDKSKAEQAEFDPDAVIARHLAQRGTEPNAATASAAPPRSFGRKGV